MRGIPFLALSQLFPVDRAHASDTLKGCEFGDALGDRISSFFDITVPRVPLVQALLLFVRRVAPHDFYLDFLISCVPRPCFRGIHEGLADTCAKAIWVVGQHAEPADVGSHFLDLSHTRNVIIFLARIIIPDSLRASIFKVSVYSL